MIQALNKCKVGEDVCMLLKLPNHSFFYMCDCGEASELTVSEAKNIKGLFMSHTHIDHFCNFDKLMRHLLPANREIIICGGEGIAKNVQCKLLAYNWNILLTEQQAEDAMYYHLREITENGIFMYEMRTPKWELEYKGEYKGEFLYENEVFRVHYAILDHRTPSIAYTFEEHPKIKAKSDIPHKAGEWIKHLKKAFLQKDFEQEITIGEEVFLSKDLFRYLEELPGYKVSVVLDHLANEENHQKIIQLCQDTDEMYIEAYYLHEELPLAQKNFHSTALLSGEVCRKSGAKKAVPIHFSRRHQKLEDLKVLFAEFKKGFEAEIKGVETEI